MFYSYEMSPIEARSLICIIARNDVSIFSVHSRKFLGISCKIYKNITHTNNFIGFN